MSPFYYKFLPNWFVHISGNESFMQSLYTAGLQSTDFEIYCKWSILRLWSLNSMCDNYEQMPNFSDIYCRKIYYLYA